MLHVQSPRAETVGEKLARQRGMLRKQSEGPGSSRNRKSDSDGAEASGEMGEAEVGFIPSSNGLQGIWQYVSGGDMKGRGAIDCQLVAKKIIYHFTIKYLIRW